MNTDELSTGGALPYHWVLLLLLFRIMRNNNFSKCNAFAGDVV